MKNSGVRFGSCTRSIFRPGSLRFLHHASIRSAAFFMWPFFSHSLSKCGDLFGMRMYSVIVGRISCSQTRSARASALALSIRLEAEEALPFVPLVLVAALLALEVVLFVVLFMAA